MNRADAPYLPLTPDVVGQHLRGGVHIGLYPLADDDTCCWLAADFDKQAAMLDALAYMKAARAYQVPAALEVSQPGLGAQVWIFFAQSTSAATARTIATNLLGEAFQLRGSMHLSSYDQGENACAAACHSVHGVLDNACLQPVFVLMCLGRAWG